MVQVDGPCLWPVSISTCTSSFDTVLAVYTGGSTFPALTRVGGDDDGCDAPNPSGSRLSFDAVAGTEYRIAAFRLAALNPGPNLEPGATYIATVTNRARDLAGNGLDQNPDVAGDQPKTWRFTVSP